MMGRQIRNTDVEIGNRLKRLRKVSGLSQGDVAANLGVTFQQVQKYENGTNRVSIGSFILICKAIGAAPMEVIGDLFDESFEPAAPALGSKIEALKSQIAQIRSIVAA